MRVADVLRSKSGTLVTIAATATLKEASELILSARVGMLLVKGYTDDIVGMLSERDLICYIATNGLNAIGSRVANAVVPFGLTASPTDSVTDIMRIMTQQRTRHLPVFEDNKLVGVISIGDILKSRIAEKDQETAVLRDMARASLAFSG